MKLSDTFVKTGKVPPAFAQISENCWISVLVYENLSQDRKVYRKTSRISLSQWWKSADVELPFSLIRRRLRAGGRFTCIRRRILSTKYFVKIGQSINMIWRNMEEVFFIGKVAWMVCANNSMDLLKSAILDNWMIWSEIVLFYKVVTADEDSRSCGWHKVERLPRKIRGLLKRTL